MRLRSWIGVFCAFAIVAPAAHAQVQLEWKLKEGDRFYLEVESTFKQTLEVAGKDTNNKIEQNLTKTIVLQFYVEKKNTDGSYVIKETVEGMKVQGAGGPEVKDEKIQGASFTLTLDLKFEVLKVEDYDQVVKKLSADDPKVAKIVKALVSEDLLKKSAQETFSFLPYKQVKVGDDPWGKEKKIKMPLGPFGSYELINTYKYEGKGTGKEKDFEKITFTTTAEYSPPKDDAGLEFKVTKGELKLENAKGTIYFDAAAGRLVSYEMSFDLTGSLTLNNNGVPLETKIKEQKQTVKATLKLQNPLVEPK
jgi:hypothetical protein